jgi:hypothetical protein
MCSDINTALARAERKEGAKRRARVRFERRRLQCQKGILHVRLIRATGLQHLESTPRDRQSAVCTRGCRRGGEDKLELQIETDPGAQSRLIESNKQKAFCVYTR